MARFRLKGPHYLNVPGTEWEQQETPLGTGAKAIRKRYSVPRFLHPDDPSDHNYPGEIIVATEASREHRADIIFEGPPTPDMEPLDEKAEAIFAKWKPMWEGQHPIESLPGTFGEALAEKFERQIEAVSRAPNVAINELDALRKQLAEQQRLIEALTARLDERPARRA